MTNVSRIVAFGELRTSKSKGRPPNPQRLGGSLEVRVSLKIPRSPLGDLKSDECLEDRGSEASRGSLGSLKSVECLEDRGSEASRTSTGPIYRDFGRLGMLIHRSFIAKFIAIHH